MAVSGSSGRGPFWWLRRRLRHADDTASSSMVTFIVGTSLFLVTSSVMLHFVAEPPGGTSGLDHADLKAKANNALSILLGTPGVPTNWGSDADSVNNLTRLGLVLDGTSIRLDPLKFRALANGSYSTQSSENGRIDYAEAVENLSLEGYNFHLRAYPLFEPFDADSYGIEDMEGFSVAYVGDWADLITEEETSKSERFNLDSLAVAFNNTTRETVFGTGDAYRDDQDQLRNLLIPLLGSAPAQTVISAGGGTPKYDFGVIDQATCETVITLLTPCSYSLALSYDDGAGSVSLGYTKNRELRTVLGLANFSASTVGTLATVEWKERLDNGGDSDDYGWLEVSPDDGDTWYTIATSTDTTALNPSSYTSRAASVTSSNCGPCAGTNEVWVAFHWVADSTGSSNAGEGWIIDDVEVTVGLDAVFTKTFESPEYDMLVIGSNVDQNAFTAAEIKNAIRDYVQLYDGRLLVLGGQTNTNWLQPLFHAGVREGSPGVGTPDSTHPLLTIPNQLDWEGFDHDNKVWDFSANGAEELFNMVVGSGEEDHVLSLSAPGAFGESDSDGVVMLTTYLPHTMSVEQAKRFFANALTYGRYHRLYMEVGPEVPSTEAVATAARTATMDKTVAGGEDFVEMTFILYIWPGASSPTVVPVQATPKPPTDLTLVASDGRIDLSWKAPLDYGESEIERYHIYRGTMAGTGTYLAQTGGINTSFVDLEATNGQTYYYNITAENTAGQGSSSAHVSATPITTPGAPSQPALVTAVPDQISLTWTAPSSGGASITGYTIYRSTDGTNFAAIGTSSSESYTDATTEGDTHYYYNVTATNSVGEGPASPIADAMAISVPQAPATISATGGVNQTSLVWTAPLSDGGSAITSYRIYRGTAPGTTTLLVDVAVPDPATFNYTWTDLTVGLNTTYYYNVTAVNSAGEGVSSSEVSATTAGVPYPPTDLTATGLVSSSVSLAWLAPLEDGGDPVTSYIVCRGTTSGNATACTDVGLVLTHTDTGLTAGTTYYYVVKAKNAVGVSNPSNEASAVPLL